MAVQNIRTSKKKKKQIFRKSRISAKCVRVEKLPVMCILFNIQCTQRDECLAIIDLAWPSC